VLIDVQALQDAPRYLAGTVAPSALIPESEGVQLNAPIAFAVHVRRDDDRVTVYGWIHSVVDVACSRCLASVHLHVDRDMEAGFMPASPDAAVGETELDEAELDTDYYSGDSIDLRAVLTEQVLLDLPMKVLCGDDCRGLCSQCGADLNGDGCDCEPPVDPRLSPLAGLRDRF
jgi:uncharacterized protein